MNTSESFLNDQRLTADIDADQLVERYFSAHKQGEIYQALGMELEQLKGLAVDNDVLRFLNNVKPRPSWYSAKQILRGQQVFEFYATDIMRLLGVLSLPYCYAGSPGNKALYHSEKMRNRPAKRLTDTAEFVLGVSTPGTLTASGIGYLQINRTRLIHAIARYYLLKGSDWNMSWGMPINQEDMAGTNLAFSYIILNGLRRSGINLSERQKEDFGYLWRYIGYQLGINEDLLPTTYREAFELNKILKKRNFRYSEEGVVLTNELLNYYRSVAPDGQSRFVNAQVRYFLGSRVSGYLGLDPEPLNDRITGLANSFQEIGNYVRIHKKSYGEMMRNYRSFNSRKQEV